MTTKSNEDIVEEIVYHVLDNLFYYDTSDRELTRLLAEAVEILNEYR